MEYQTEEQLERDTVQDIFNEEDIYQYEYASAGQRFVNYLIDVLLLRFVLSYGAAFLIGALFALLFPEQTGQLDSLNDSSLVLIGLAVWIIVFLAYYTLCEKFCKGYTLGKLVSGTRAICVDGTELTFKDAFMRSLCRLVPFEPLSGFGGHPWHDQWTDTMVVKVRR